MTPTQQPSDILADVFKIVEEVTHNHLVHPYDGTADVEASTFLITAMREIRFPLIRSIDQFERVWDGIRISTEVVDFVLGLTTELRFRLDALSYTSWDQVVDKLVTAYSQFTGQNSTMDPNLKERLPEQAVKGPNQRRGPDNPGLADLYRDNPWFVALLLVYHGQVMRTFVSRR